MGVIVAAARTVLSRFATALLLTACSPLPRMPEPPPEHPASAHAIEVAIPQRTWLLDLEAPKKQDEETAKEEAKTRQGHQHGHSHGHGGKK